MIVLATKTKQTARSRSPRDYTATFLEKDEAKELELCTFQPNVSSTQNRCVELTRGSIPRRRLDSARLDHTNHLLCLCVPGAWSAVVCEGILILS